MPERPFAGTAASPGVAVGTAWRPAEAADSHEPVPGRSRPRERDTAVAALAAAAEELRAVAIGRPREEAEIIETGVLMGQDPALIGAVEAAIVTDGLDAQRAIIRATGEHAEVIAQIDDETLAARADDVRSLGRRAARIAAGRGVELPPGRDVVLIGSELGPGDVAELAPALAGIALAGGGATAHAAIVARSLGLPMVTGLGEGVLGVLDGATVVLDASSGTLIQEPSAARVQSASAEMATRRRAASAAQALRDQPAITTDAIRITVLVNVASPQELQVGLRSGAEGIGLLRTELAFLDAERWPSELEHAQALQPILDELGTHPPRPAVVRVLDFGADKSPPFLHDAPGRGLGLLLAHPDAFVRQLRAILIAAQRHDVRILLPMVDSSAQVAHARGLIEQIARTLGLARIPPVGSMIETPAAADSAAAIAEHSDFLSIGTNDLTAATLRADRFAANNACAHHPMVLRSIARSARAAHEAGIQIEVCGEAASEAVMLPLLVGLGIDEISVGAARVGQVRTWIRRLCAADAAGLARSALTMDDEAEVAWAAETLAAQLDPDVFAAERAR